MQTTTVTTPVNWSPTTKIRRDLGDPNRNYVPGNPAQVRALANQTGNLADGFVMDAQELMRVVSSVLGPSARWSGSFHQGFTRVGPMFSRILTNELAPQLRHAADALNRYAGTMEQLKGQAAHQVRRGEAAEERRVSLLVKAEQVAAQPTENPTATQSQVQDIKAQTSAPNSVVTDALNQLQNIKARRRETDHILASTLSDVGKQVHQVAVHASEVSQVVSASGPSQPGSGGGDGDVDTGPVAVLPPPSIGDPSTGVDPTTPIDATGPSVPGIGGGEVPAGPEATGTPSISASRPGTFAVAPGGTDPFEAGSDAGGGGLSTAAKVGLGGAAGAAVLGGAAMLHRRGSGGAAAGTGSSGGSSSRSGASTGPGTSESAAPGVRGRRARAAVAGGVGAAGGRKTSSEVGDVDWGTVVPVVGAAACAAAGMVVAGDRMSRSAAAGRGSFSEKWLDLGRKALGRRTLESVEAKAKAAAAGLAVVDGGSPRYPTVEELPGGLVADIPGGWTVARGDDCIVITPGSRGGSFAGNIVLFADPSGGSQLLAGIDEMPGNVLVELGQSAAAASGERVRFGYAVGRSALTVHRHLLQGEGGVIVVVTSTVATDRLQDDARQLDAVIGTMRHAA